MGENTHNFQKLTPVDSVDLALYEDALDFIFDNPDIRNVAISGAYGAGKSSILATYKKKHNGLKFVHISLAHFEQPEKYNDNSPGVKESILEGKILNQLIHQIPAEKIPQTNFKVKKKISRKSIARDVVCIMVFIISVLHIILFDSWSSLVILLPDTWLKTQLSLSINKEALLVSWLLCAISFCAFLIVMIRAQKNKNIFRKISLQGNEIEILGESEESYFDKYLNEVLYLFESVDADVIVFEDLDRFNANRIFERLREVNTLANIQLKKEDSPPIRFFYLLRDDIFVNKDRTKFFDYIVPVVPVIDSSNSYDQFISHFKEGGIFQLFDESFLQGLSLYIDEMRILKNIYNEFIIYYKRLNTIELDCNKMLALITYKNLFPRDFNELQLNKGFVYTLFSSKSEFIDEEMGKFNEQIAIFTQIIEDSNKEHLQSASEVDELYKARLERTGNQMRRESLVAESEKRKEAITNKGDEQRERLKEEILQCHHNVASLKEKKLSELISRDNIDAIFSVISKNEIGGKNDYSDIKSSDYFSLLKYLIRDAYLDETYADYMTYFYENSLSRIDKTFLRSITDKKAKEYTYQLKNPPLVVSRLRPVDFDQEETLNFDLLHYLLQTSAKKDFRDRLLQQLRDTKNLKFIWAFFDTAREQPAYIKCLNIQWPCLFSHALNNVAFSSKQLWLYSIYTLYYSSDDDIQAVNMDNCLTRYISESEDYLSISKPDIDKLICGFILLDVAFESIESESADKELFESVYNGSLYEINFQNISLMLRKFYQVNNEDEIQHRNYTKVMSQPESPLAKYIQDNIGLYMDVILSNCNGQIQDAEEIALLILNNKEVAPEKKVAYIDSLETIIASIMNVEDKSLWNHLVTKRLVKYSVENIMDYFENSESIDAALAQFIDDNESSLDFSRVKNSHGEDKAEKFFDAVIICNNLPNQKYREILTTLGFDYSDFDVNGVSDEKMAIIIDNDIITMNLDTLLFIRMNYPKQTKHYIKHSIKEYANILTDEKFDLGEALTVLSWDVNESVKIELLRLTTEKIPIIGKKYSTAVNAYILKHNLYVDETPKLFASYDEWEAEIQAVILECAINKFASIVAAPSDVSRNLLKALFESQKLSDSRRIELFISSLPYFDEAVCIEILDVLNLTEYKKIFKPLSRPKFEITDTNRKLLEAFRDKHFIRGFEEDQVKAGFYKIIRNRPTSKTLEIELL